MKVPFDLKTFAGGRLDQQLIAALEQAYAGVDPDIGGKASVTLKLSICVPDDRRAQAGDAATLDTQIRISTPPPLGFSRRVLLSQGQLVTDPEEMDAAGTRALPFGEVKR